MHVVHVLCHRSLRMWIEDYKKNLKYSNNVTPVTMDHTTNSVTATTTSHMIISRSKTTLTPPSHIPPVMATSVAPTGNRSLYPVDYSVSDIVFNQPARHLTHLPPSTVVNARPPLLPYVQPGCFIYTTGNQYMASTGVYTHQWGAAPLLATPRSQNFPIHPFLPPLQRNVLLPRHPHPTFQQQPYPYNMQVQQYPHPARPLLHPMPRQGLAQHSNTSKSLHVGWMMFYTFLPCAGSSSSLLSDFTFLSPALANFKLDYSQIINV